MKLRKFIFWSHLIAGVLAGVIILVMSFTGLCLAFAPQMTAGAESNLRNITPPASGKTDFDYDAIVAKARAENPDATLTALTLRVEPTASVMLNFGREGVLFMNPYTGEALGRGSKLRGILQQVENVHRWLGANEDHRATGRIVTGAANLVFLLLALTGIYIWWPRNCSWNALRPSVFFVGGLRGKARDWNWHNTIGIWCAPVLIILTLTGTVMSYQWANNLLYRLTGNEPPPPIERQAGNPGRNKSHHAVDSNAGQKSSASLDTLIAKAKEQLPQWSTMNVRLAQRAGGPVVIVLQEMGSREFYRSQLTLDSANAEIIKWEPFVSQNSGRKLRIWARFLHTGEAGGAMGQAIVAMVCVGGIMLVWTGLAMAWRRFFGTRPQIALT